MAGEWEDVPESETSDEGWESVEETTKTAPSGKTHEQIDVEYNPAAGGIVGAGAGLAAKGIGIAKNRFINGGNTDKLANAAKTGLEKYATGVFGEGAEVRNTQSGIQRANQRELGELVKSQTGARKPIRLGGLNAGVAQAAAPEMGAMRAAMAKAGPMLEGAMPAIKAGAGKLLSAANPMLALAGTGAEYNDMRNRFEKGQYGRGVVSGLGALGSAATMVPHPGTKIVGGAAAIGAPTLNMFLDKMMREQDEKERMQAQQKAAGGVVGYARGGQVHRPVGGLVYLADGGLALRLT